jgi:hypothetical protein
VFAVLLTAPHGLDIGTLLLTSIVAIGGPLVGIVVETVRRLWTKVAALETQLQKVTKEFDLQASQIRGLKIEVNGLLIEQHRPGRYFENGELLT